MAGIKERMIQYVLRAQDMLSPAANKGREALDELRTAGEKVRAELDKATDDNKLVKSLVGVAKDSERTEKSIERVNKRIESLHAELEKNPNSKGLVTSLTAAEREAKNANTALEVLKQQAAEYAEKAKAAGIDTSKLSDEEKRLAAELEKAKAAVSDNSKATKDLQKEQAAAARSAAEQKAETAKLGEVVSAAGKRVLAYAAAYVSLKTALSAVRGVTDFVVSGFKSVFNGASESEQVLAQLNAALASTEGAIGITADELQRMGLEMRKTSMLSTEQITEMQVALLTYTDIAKEEFPRALQVAIDQQQRLGISITQSAELVGKALQDPSKAMVALGRQGFKLEESQKTLLKQLEDTGRTAEAQSIIMDMLAESYGGSAAAARYGTFKGIWKGITDTFSDFQSKIANSGSFDLVKNKLQDFSDLLTEMEQDGTLDALAMSISSAFEVGANKVEEFVRKLATIDFKTLADDSSKWLGDFEEKINSSITAVTRLTAPVRVLANVITGFGAAALTAFSGVVFGSLSLLSVLAKAIPDMFGGDTIVKGLESARDSVKEMMGGLAKQVSTDFNDIKSAVNDLMGTTADAAGEAAAAVSAAEGLQLAALKKSYAERKISIDEYIKGLETIKLRLSELTQVSQTEHESALEQLETLYQASHKIAQQRAEGLLSDEAHAAAQANLQAAIEQVKAKVDETSESFKGYSDQLKETQESIAATSKTEQESIKTKAQLIQELRDEQKRLGEQFFADQITQEEWEAGHNSANEAIRELGKSVGETVVKISSLQEAEEAFTTASTVEELEAFKKALFDAYSNKQIDLENFQRLHNQASLAIRELGGSSVESASDLTTLDGVMKAIAKSANNIDTRAAQAALDKLYKERKIDAKEYAKAQEEINKKVAELKPAAEKSTKAVDEMGESLDEASGGLTVINNNVGRAAASFAWFMGMLDNVREPLEQMSEAAVAAFNDLQGITNTPNIDTSSLSSVTDALQRVRDETGRLEMALNSTFDANISDTLSRWAIQTKLNGKEVEMSYLAQKESLLSLMRTVDAGGLSLDYLASLAGEASSRFDLLSESDLSPLVAAANQAKEAMRAFSESTQSTVDNLRMELLQLRGTEEEIAKARAEQRRNELREQLAMAEKNNDRESIARLQEALGLLNQIESEQINRIRTAAEEKAAEAQRKEQEAQQKAVDAAQREADAQRKEAESKKQAAEREKEAKNKAREKDSTGRPVIGQQYQQPAAGSPIVTRVIRIESRSGQGVDLGIRSASDEIKLLSVLEDAGLRSL